MIGVRFRHGGKIYSFQPGINRVERGDHVIVETSRGVEYGMVVQSPRLASDKDIVAPVRTILRKATEKDEETNRHNIQAEKEDSDLTSAFSTISTTDEVEPASDTFSYSSVADVAENAMPSIVAITNKSVEEVEGWFRGQVFQYESESAGSGIIVGQNDDELLICTNNHVVEDATELTVTFIDEESYPGQVKGTDPSNDLAVVAVNLDDINSDTMDQIKIAQAGDSDDLRVGEQVVAIGNALGYGQCGPVDPLFPEGQGTGSHGLCGVSREYASPGTAAGRRQAQAGPVPGDEREDEQDDRRPEQDRSCRSASYAGGPGGP